MNSAHASPDVVPHAQAHEEHDAHNTSHTHHGKHRNHPAQEPPAGPGKRVVSALAGVALVGSLLALGIMPRLKQQKKLDAMAVVEHDSVTPVNVVLPEYTKGGGEIVLPGNIQAVEETTINARTGGYLRHRFVDIGSRVKAGQLLAEIEAPEVDEQLMQARAETSKSQAGGEQAQADVARLQANVAQAQAELARAESNREAARADLAHAKAKELESESALAQSQALLAQTRKKINARKADQERARTRYALAEKTWKRWQQLAKGGAVSGQELDETQAAFETAQSSVTGAQADVESAQADVEAAQANVGSRQGDVAAAQADVSAAQEKVSAAQSAILSSQASIRAMQAAVTASQSNVRAAQATIASSKAGVNRYAALKSFERITAPFNGVITARNVDTGALINAGSSTSASNDPTSTVPHSGLFGIARTDVLRIQVNVPEASIDTIKAGQTARVTVQEKPGRVFTGVVSRTAGALDAGSRTLLTEIRLANPDNALIPGMYAQVEFAGKQAKPLLRVPADTLIIDGQGTRVATVTKNNKLHFKTVRLGRDYGKEVEITQGIAANDPLVENPTDDLQEGMPVQVVSNGKQTRDK